MITRITPLTDPGGPRLAWVAAAGDGRPLGTAFLRVPSTGGSAELDLHVHPAERRAGVGTRLLDAVAAAAADQKLGSIRTDAVPDGSAGDLFCIARGLRRVLALTYTRLPLEAVVPSPTPVPGYRILHWEGTVPDELAETFARARPAMDDMPMDDADYVPQSWDVDALHKIADAVARRGEILCTTAVQDADGEIVGFTEVVVAGDGLGDGQHYGTGVLPGHRGRGLARWLKISSIARVRDRFPRLSGLLADTADSNAAMRHLNDSLGYRPTHRSVMYQLDLSPAT